MRTEAERKAAFWARVDRTAPDECWPWKGAKGENGRGYVGWWHGRRYVTEKAYRVAFLLANGFLPRGRGGRVIRHLCNNPICCNPAHLQAGSQKDNIADAIQAGTASRPPLHVGSRHPRAKLDERKVITIRRALKAGATVASIARAYGVGETTVTHLKNGTTWRHVAET